MAFADQFPLHESIGVFVSVSGLDWLTEGYAEPVKAILAAAAAAGLITAGRRWRRRQQERE